MENACTKLMMTEQWQPGRDIALVVFRPLPARFETPRSVAVSAGYGDFSFAPKIAITLMFLLILHRTGLFWNPKIAARKRPFPGKGCIPGLPGENDA